VGQYTNDRGAARSGTVHRKKEPFSQSRRDEPKKKKRRGWQTRMSCWVTEGNERTKKRGGNTTVLRKKTLGKTSNEKPENGQSKTTKKKERGRKRMKLVWASRIPEGDRPKKKKVGYQKSGGKGTREKTGKKSAKHDCSKGIDWGRMKNQTGKGKLRPVLKTSKGRTTFSCWGRDSPRERKKNKGEEKIRSHQQQCWDSEGPRATNGGGRERDMFEKKKESPTSKVPAVTVGTRVGQTCQLQKRKKKKESAEPLDRGRGQWGKRRTGLTGRTHRTTPGGDRRESGAKSQNGWSALACIGRAVQKEGKGKKKIQEHGRPEGSVEETHTMKCAHRNVGGADGGVPQKTGSAKWGSTPWGKRERLRKQSKGGKTTKRKRAKGVQEGGGKQRLSGTAQRVRALVPITNAPKQTIKRGQIRRLLRGSEHTVHKVEGTGEGEVSQARGVALSKSWVWAGRKHVLQPTRGVQQRTKKKVPLGKNETLDSTPAHYTGFNRLI